MANSNMFSSFTRLSIKVITLLITLCLILSTAKAETLPKYEFNQKHQAGVRLGGWSNQGINPSTVFSVSSFQFNSDIGSGSAYFEGFVAYRFNSFIIGELSAGVVNRGEVQVSFTNTIGTEQYFGNLNVYPMLAKLRFYPMGGLNKGIFPYFIGGAGVYYIRHDIFAAGVNTTSIGFIPEASKTTFNYVAGAGVDIPLTPVVGLDIQAEYFPIDLSENFRGTNDWSALTITVGVKYLFKSPDSKKNKKDRRRGPRREG